MRNFIHGRGPERREVDLNQVVGDCLQFVAFDLHRNEVTLDVALAPQLPPVLTDQTQLTQIVVNLILNAMQAMEANERPRILNIQTVRTTTDAGHDGIRMAIRDTGHGIDSNHRENLFNQFFTTKKTGLGMACRFPGRLPKTISAA